MKIWGGVYVVDIGTVDLEGVSLCFDVILVPLSNGFLLTFLEGRGTHFFEDVVLLCRRGPDLIFSLVPVRFLLVLLFPTHSFPEMRSGGELAEGFAGYTAGMPFHNRGSSIL